jgi:hypothetical protein
VNETLLAISRQLKLNIYHWTAYTTDFLPCKYSTGRIGMEGLNTYGNFSKYYYCFWMKSTALTAGHFAMLKKMNITMQHSHGRIQHEEKIWHISVQRINVNFGTLLKERKTEGEKGVKGEYLDMRQHLTERWRKNAYLVASKFVHFTKCCLSEHIQEYDICVKLIMNINTLVAKGTWQTKS